MLNALKELEGQWGATITQALIFLAATVLLISPTLYFHLNQAESFPDNKPPVLFSEAPAFTEQKEEIIEIEEEASPCEKEIKILDEFIKGKNT